MPLNPFAVRRLGDEMTLHPKTLAPLTFLVLLALASPLGAESSSCAGSALLRKYQSAGLVTWTSDTTLELRLDADHHSADCGTADCYGTKILLTLSIDPASVGCTLNAAKAVSKPYSRPGCEDAPVRPVASYSLVPTPKRPRLDDPSLERLELRSQSTRHAIVLLAENFFYFEDVVSGGALRTTLDPGLLEDAGCCWGASSAELQCFEAGRDR